MTAGGRSSFGAAFAVREFRALWAAELLSIAGDQLARVALSVLVYDRTASAGLTGLTYALTYLPTMLGSVLLSWLADRHPRRTVMVWSDLVRAAGVAAMAVPGLPLWPLCVLLGATMLVSGPFKAAQLAMLPDVLPDEDRYVTALAIRNITNQAAQLAGFAGGGAVVVLVTSSGALLLDAGTFVASALLVRFAVRHRPGAGAARLQARGWRTLGTGAALIRRDRGLIALTALSWLAGFYIAPEGLAAPFGATVGGGAVVVGLVLASGPAGSALGAFVFGRWVPATWRKRLLGPFGVLAGAPLLVLALRPGLMTALLLFALSGAFCTAYQMQAGAEFVRRVPGSGRAQAIGLVSGGLLTVQGAGAAFAGVLADATGAAAAIALFGAVGALCGLPTAIAWTRADGSAVQAFTSPDPAA